MRKFNTYYEAETALISEIVYNPDFTTATTQELICTGFILKNPLANCNIRSNYEYADEFFKWLLTGEKQLSQELLNLNPWVKRFVDTVGLPDNFSSSYGWKIKEQIDVIKQELVNHDESRRGYVNILTPDDAVILTTKTTHEYPCTIGFQFFIRNNDLHMVVNMRSNNAYSVMPYDVYNFTMLQHHVAQELKIGLGLYYHQINNAHIYKGDVRRIKQSANV